MTEKASPTGKKKTLTGTVVVDIASIAAATVALTTVAIAEALPGDVVLFAPPAAGLSVAVLVGIGYCAAAGSVRMPVVNPSAGALDPASVTFNYALIRD